MKNMNNKFAKLPFRNGKKMIKNFNALKLPKYDKGGDPTDPTNPNSPYYDPSNPNYINQNLPTYNNQTNIQDTKIPLGNNTQFNEKGLANVGSQVVGMAGNALTNNSYKNDTSIDPNRVQRVNQGKMIGGDAMKGAGMGLEIGSSIGTIIPGVGTAIGAGVGAGVGAIAGGIYGAVDSKNINDKANKEVNAWQDKQAQAKAQKATYDLNNQKIYSNNYYANNPTTGTQGTSLMANGGELDDYINLKKAEGKENYFYNKKVDNNIYRATGMTYQEHIDKYPTQENRNARYIQERKYMQPGLATDMQLANGGYLAPGGQLTPIANGIVKAEGDTHQEDSNQDGQTGITLQGKNGQPYAEVENQEIINKGKVYSDRLSPNNKDTYAKISEGLAKKKAKFEDNLQSNNILQVNTAKRMTANIDKELEALFQHQEVNKPQQNNQKFDFGGNLGDGNPSTKLVKPFDYNTIKNYNQLLQLPVADRINSPKMFFNNNPGVNGMRVDEYGRKYINGVSDTGIPMGGISDMSQYNAILRAKQQQVMGNNIPVQPDYAHPFRSNLKAYGGKLDKYPDGGNVDWTQVAQTTAPYLSNLYSMGLIKQIPQTPIPTTKVAYNQQAANMNTDYNINPALNDAQKQYQTFNQGITQNTASSQAANAQKMGAFANILDNKSQLYGQKINAESQMKNMNSLNTQNVMNQNTQNAQEIANTNLAQTDSYNWANAGRASNILEQKSNIAANAGNKITTQIQDSNLAKLDRERMQLDSLKYPDAAGAERMIGTKTMDEEVRNNPRARAAYRDKFKQSKQDAALLKFNQTYGID